MTILFSFAIITAFGQIANKTIDLLQGTWVHEEDSLSTLAFTNNQCTFNYGEKRDTVNTNRYQILVTNELPKFVKETEKAEFLILTNSTDDTLYYEILGLNDSLMSLMHFPTGKRHLYKRLN